MPLHDVGYRPWTGTRRAGGAAGVIAGTGIRLAFKSRWLRRVLLFAWSPALVFAAGFFAFEQAVEESARGLRVDSIAARLNRVDSFGTVGALFGNVLQSTRGLMAVAIGPVLAHAGWHDLEERVDRGIFLRRLAAATLMVIAVLVYVADIS